MAVDWNIVDEIRLFRWVSEFKPVGIHRHFHMFCILERMNNPDKYPVIMLQKENYHRPPKLFTSKDIWLKLKQYYNLDEANNIENDFMTTDHDHEQAYINELKLIENDSRFNDTKLFQNEYRLMTEIKDFSLPWDEYGDLILSNAIKKKNSVIDKESESRIKVTNNIGGVTIENNKNIIKSNDVQNEMKQDNVVASGEIDKDVKEEKNEVKGSKVFEHGENLNELNKTNEQVLINVQQNQSNNSHMYQTKLTTKDVVEEVDKNENHKNIETNINNEKKSVVNVKDVKNPENFNSDTNAQKEIVEDIKEVGKTEDHEKIEGQSDSQIESNKGTEDIDKQEDSISIKYTNESEDIQICEQPDLNKEEEKNEENTEANKDISPKTKQAEVQEKESDDSKKEKVHEEEKIKSEQQIQNEQLEVTKDEENAVSDNEVEKGINIQELQKETEDSFERRGTSLNGNRDETDDNRDIENNAKKVNEELDKKELSSDVEGGEMIKEGRVEEEDNEAENNEQSNDEENQNEIQIENEDKDHELEVPQRQRRKRVYPRAHRISSRLRRKSYGNEANNESNVEPVEAVTEEVTEEGENVKKDENNLKRKLSMQKGVVDNEPLAKRTRHSLHNKATKLEENENQQPEETVTSSSRKSKKKNSSKTVESNRVSSRLRNKK